MNELLLSFLSWVKDPFGKKNLLNKHSVLIGELYAAEAVTRKVTDSLDQQRNQRRYYAGGVNPIDRALLGNQPRTKD